MARPRNLQARLFLLVILAFLPALGLYWYSNRELGRLQLQGHVRDLVQVTQLAGVEYERLLEDSEALLGSLAEIPEIREAEVPACNELLARVQDHTPRYTTISVIGLDGYLMCGSLPVEGGLYLGDRAYFARAVEDNRFAIGVYQLGRITGKPTLGVALPVTGSQGEVERIIGASIDLTHLGNVADQATLPEDATFTVLDRNGRVLVRRPRGRDPVVGDSVGAMRPEGFPALPEEWGAVVREGVDLDSFEKVFAVAALRGESARPEGYLTVARHESELLTQVDRIAQRELRYLAISGLIILVVAWLWGHYGMVRWAAKD